MVIRLFALFGLLVLGCSRTKEATPNYELPREMSDCRIYEVCYTDGNDCIIAVRCPNSTTSTTYTVGKSTATVVTIDGVEYSPVGK